MTLYDKWDVYGEESKTDEEYKEIVEAYLIKEKDVYDYMLSNTDELIEGTIAELGKRFNMTDVEFLGFVDGINESIKEPYDLQTLTADSQVKLEVNYEALYLNMLDASAEWLYNLKQWDDILTKDERLKIKKDFNRSKIVVKDKKIGRNEPCTCGSGKKYKKCCGR